MERRTLQVITTEDGSQSLYCPELSETYHSTKGAVEESLYVYLRQGFEKVLHADEEIYVLEIGFGTGLNVILTLDKAIALKQATFFHTLEPYPVEKEIWKQLHYAEPFNLESEWKLMHESTWNTLHQLAPIFKFKKEQLRLEDVVLEYNKYHVVYFDGFAPQKQADIWCIENLEKIFKAMRNNAIVVTYSAQAEMRKRLKQVGFLVETLKGPPGKREMTLARKIL